MRRYLCLRIFFFILAPLTAQQQDFAHIDFTRAEAIARQYRGEDLTNLPVLSHKLTAFLETDVEQFRAIYYWVTHTIAGNNRLQTKNERKSRKLRDSPLELKAWQKAFAQEVIQKLREDKTTVCTGYAYLLQKMATYAGIECVLINGYGLINSKKQTQNPNHSWNAIKLGNKWYLCDATWAAGYTDVLYDLFEFDYDDRYFLMEPTEFAKTHTPVNESWLLIPSEK
jgi:transglutaminase/protease-like cytokinesis protein 3